MRLTVVFGLWIAILVSLFCCLAAVEGGRRGKAGKKEGRRRTREKNTQWHERHMNCEGILHRIKHLTDVKNKKGEGLPSVVSPSDADARLEHLKSKYQEMNCSTRHHEPEPEQQEQQEVQKPKEQYKNPRKYRKREL